VGFPGTREALEDGNQENAKKWNNWAVRALNQSLEVINSI
jgi:hypothetical protein